MAEYIKRENALKFQDELEPCFCRSAITGEAFTATKDADLVPFLQNIPALLDFKARLRGMPPETTPILAVPQLPRKAPKPFLEMYKEFQRNREIARFIEAVEKLSEQEGKP